MAAEAAGESPFLPRLAMLMLRRGQFELSLKWAIADLFAKRPNDVLAATSRQSAEELRRRVRAVAERSLGEGTFLISIDSILEKARVLEQHCEYLLDHWQLVDPYKKKYLEEDLELDADPVVAADLHGVAGEYLALTKAIMATLRHAEILPHVKLTI